MWKNIVETGRPQMAIWRMHITWRIHKATNTHSEYVMLIDCSLQQWLLECVSVLTLYVHCLFHTKQCKVSTCRNSIEQRACCPIKKTECKVIYVNTDRYCGAMAVQRFSHLETHRRPISCLLSKGTLPIDKANAWIMNTGWIKTNPGFTIDFVLRAFCTFR